MKSPALDGKFLRAKRTGIIASSELKALEIVR